MATEKKVLRAKVKVLMIAEMEVEGEDLEAAAQAKLDEFREAVLPEMNWGITLYRHKAQRTGKLYDVLMVGEGDEG